jgi:hypothetical protein
VREARIIQPALEVLYPNRMFDLGMPNFNHDRRSGASVAVGMTSLTASEPSTAILRSCSHLRHDELGDQLWPWCARHAPTGTPATRPRSIPLRPLPAYFILD